MNSIPSEILLTIEVRGEVLDARIEQGQASLTLFVEGIEGEQYRDDSAGADDVSCPDLVQ